MVKAVRNEQAMASTVHKTRRCTLNGCGPIKEPIYTKSPIEEDMMKACHDATMVVVFKMLII